MSDDSQPFFPSAFPMLFFFFQCFLQRLVFRVSMAASSWLCKGPPRQILLSPLLSSQLPNSRSQQWALVDQLANLITLGWLPWDLLPERRRQRFVLPGINTSWIWICLLQTPPSTYLLIIIVPITTFLLTKALISQQKYSTLVKGSFKKRIGLRPITQTYCLLAMWPCCCCCC